MEEKEKLDKKLTLFLGRGGSFKSISTGASQSLNSSSVSTPLSTTRYCMPPGVTPIPRGERGPVRGERPQVEGGRTRGGASAMTVDIIGGELCLCHLNVEPFYSRVWSHKAPAPIDTFIDFVYSKEWSHNFSKILIFVDFFFFKF